MESEAILDGELGEEIATRRRSHSFSDDYSVQKTNDDATHCKAAAVQVGIAKARKTQKNACSWATTRMSS